MNGWVKIHRKILDWEWYTDSKMVHLLIHMILSANHDPGSWQGVKLLPGQFISGRLQLSQETGISQQSVRTCIKRLKSTSELTTKNYNKFTVFTLNNWKLYQSEFTPTSILTSNQPAINQQLTTNKKEKKEKNNKKFKKPTVQEINEYCLLRNNGIDGQYFFDSNEARGWVVGKNCTPMRDWKATVRTWESNRKNTPKPKKTYE